MEEHLGRGSQFDTTDLRDMMGMQSEKQLLHDSEVLTTNNQQATERLTT